MPLIHGRVCPVTLQRYVIPVMLAASWNNLCSSLLMMCVAAFLSCSTRPWLPDGCLISCSPFPRSYGLPRLNLLHAWHQIGPAATGWAMVCCYYCLSLFFILWLALGRIASKRYKLIKRAWPIAMYGHTVPIPYCQYIICCSCGVSLVLPSPAILFSRPLFSSRLPLPPY
jgi:hypothetical protein